MAFESAGAHLNAINLVGAIEDEVFRVKMLSDVDRGVGEGFEADALNDPVILQEIGRHAIRERKLRLDRARARYQNDPERVRKRMREYYHRNREAILARARERWANRNRGPARGIAPQPGREPPAPPPAAPPSAPPSDRASGPT